MWEEEGYDVYELVKSFEEKGESIRANLGAWRSTLELWSKQCEDILARCHGSERNNNGKCVVFACCSALDQPSPGFVHKVANANKVLEKYIRLQVLNSFEQKMT
jgi:hypothetical protein